LAAEVGAFPIELAERLIPAAGLRNLLVHRYGDIDVVLLVEATTQVLTGFDDYVAAVARWLKEEPTRRLRG
jgi:uncharacterized protein YutE (UPF0331/DUF86 family)